MGETDIDEAFEDDTWDGATSEDEDGTHPALDKSRSHRGDEVLRHAEEDEADEDITDVDDAFENETWDGATSADEDGTKAGK